MLQGSHTTRQRERMWCWQPACQHTQGGRSSVQRPKGRRVSSHLGCNTAIPLLMLSGAVLPTAAAAAAAATAASRTGTTAHALRRTACTCTLLPLASLPLTSAPAAPQPPPAAAGAGLLFGAAGSAGRRRRGLHGSQQAISSPHVINAPLPPCAPQGCDVAAFLKRALIAS